MEVPFRTLAFQALCLFLISSGSSLAASDLQIGLNQVKAGKWSEAKASLAPLVAESCMAGYLLGLAEAHLPYDAAAADAAEAEIGAIPCLYEPYRRGGIMLLQWSLNVLAEQRLGPAQVPHGHNPYV